MKGRLPSFIMVLVALALVFSMVATVAPSANLASAQTGGLNSWVRHDLPTTLQNQMFPNSDIWDLTAADDGTLFALVEDTSGAGPCPAALVPQVGGGLSDLDERPMVAGCWNGMRWAVFPAYSDISLMKSTDGGYEWDIVWHQPASDTAAPIAVVPQPGYVDGDAANQQVFVLTGIRYLSNYGPPNFVGEFPVGSGSGNLYRSFNGGEDFTRVTPRNPAVTLIPVGACLTSMDVGENVNQPGTFFALVGVAGSTIGTGRGEGVYTWNEGDDGDWEDKMVANALPPAPFPGTMPAGNGFDVLAVKVSDNYAEDMAFIAAGRDTNPADPSAQNIGLYTCMWDGNDGTWGGDVDSPTNAALGAIPGPMAYHMAIATADDYSNGNNVFVAVDGSGGHTTLGLRDDVWRVAGRSTVTGPSAAAARGIPFDAGTPGILTPHIQDIVILGSAGGGALYAGIELPGELIAANPRITGQAQVVRGEAMTLWPTWTPSFKPPSGSWPVLLTTVGETLMAAGGGDGYTTSGVHKCAAGCAACPGGRMVFNGIGLLDDIAVSEDIPGYWNPGLPAMGPPGVSRMGGTTWCLAEAVNDEVSWTYATDNLIYVSTYSDWNHNADPTMAETPRPFPTELSLWRWTDSMHWERILYEHVTMPTAYAGIWAGGASGVFTAADYHQYRGKPMLTNHGLSTFYNDWTWWPRVTRDFSEDPYVFLLGGRGSCVAAQGAAGWIQELLWYSPDLGDTWIPVAQMPLGTRTFIPLVTGAGLSESGWWVETNNVVFMGDIAGWVYKTTDRGASWTEGALTALGLEITTIITSPIYSETGESDQAVLAGTFDGPIPTLIPSGQSALAFPGWLPAASDLKNEVWLCQDGCIQDLENVGAEISTDPAWSGHPNRTDVDQALGGCVVQFDTDWENNNIVYSTAGGWMDRWQLVGPGATVLTRIDTTDVGFYRTEVDLTDPSASTWEQIWGADDFMAVTKDPQPLPQMDLGVPPGPKDNVYRAVHISGIERATDGTLYVPFAVWDLSYNTDRRPPEPPSPMFWPGWFANGGNGRFTNGGVLRTLDGTQAMVEITEVGDGLGEWDGLFLNDAVPGGSNTLISLAWDWQEWRFKLAILDDTLSTTTSPSSPQSGETGVGTLADNQVSVTLTWGALDADVYEWQVDDDCGFIPPLVATGVTSEELVTVANLEPGVSYCWRSRATEPYWSRWSPPQSFTTVIGSKLLAPELLAPAPGATILETNPTFQWTSIGWADKYQIQVGTSSAFGSSDMVVNENLGDVQAYQATKELALGTYYWHVKASSDTSSTEWSSTGTFTISEGLPGAEGTSAWVWVLIVVGILLIILILVLIMRTRRPA